MADTGAARLQRDLQRWLTRLIQRDADDPALQLVTITAVEISRGSHDAVVRVHAPLESLPQAQCVARLNRMAPHFEHSLRRHLQRRRLPHLRFAWDQGMDDAATMMAKLRELHRE